MEPSQYPFFLKLSFNSLLSRQPTQLLEGDEVQAVRLLEDV